MLRCQRLTLRSSADMYVSPSLFIDIELIWYVWALENILLGLASTISSMGCTSGIRRYETLEGSLSVPSSSTKLKPQNFLSLSETFHNLMVLSERGEKQKKGVLLTQVTERGTLCNTCIVV